MDAVLDKRDLIVAKYVELSKSDNPSREVAVDLRQELNRSDHLIRHHLRAQFNYAGRFLGMGAFSTAGLIFILKSTALNQKLTFKHTIINIGILSGFAGLGYLYGSTFHSKGGEASANRDKAEARVDKLNQNIIEAEKLLEEKLNKAKI